jgi:hypothetical protein
MPNDIFWLSYKTGNHITATSLIYRYYSYKVIMEKLGQWHRKYGISIILQILQTLFLPQTPKFGECGNTQNSVLQRHRLIVVISTDENSTNIISIMHT